MRSILAVLSILAATTISAQTVDEIAMRIAADNPAVRSAHLSSLAQAEEIRGENVLPDPVVEFEHLWGNKGAGNKLTAGVSQEFQLPALFSNRESLAKGYEKSGGAATNALMLSTVLDAKLAIIDIIHTRRTIDRLGVTLANIDTLQVYATKAVQDGVITVLDKKKIEIERIRMRQQIAELESQLPDLYGRLSSLGNGSDYSALLDGIVTFPQEQLLSLDRYLEISSTDPRFQQYTNDSQIADLQLKVAKSERLPVFSLGYIYNLEAGVTFTGLNASVSLPLYSDKHKRKAIELSRIEADASAEALTAELQGSVTALYKEVTMLRSQIDELRPLVEDKSTLQVITKAYKERLITACDFIGDVNYFTEAALALYDTEYRYAIALARLNAYNLVQ